MILKIHESGENYLETIFFLLKRKGSVRAVDIANELDYAKPSVSRAMGILKDAGYITVESNGNIVLTATGMNKAEQVYERHNVLTQFLTEILHVDLINAEADACRIEHVISNETFDAVKNYLKEKSV